MSAPRGALTSGGGEGSYLLGALCLAGNALCFAVYSAAGKRLLAGLSPFTTTAGVLVAGAVPLLVAATLAGWDDLQALSGAQWAAVFYLALVCSVAAYFAYHVALSRLEATRAATWIYLEPVIAFAFGWALLGEAVTATVLAGAAAIALGVAVVTRDPAGRV